VSSIIPYTCQDSKRRPRFSSKATNFTALDAMILPSCSFLLWSVFFFPLFLPDAMPKHSELIDGDTGLGVYWESKNSFIRNYARLYWRAGAVRVSCPVQLGGRASGMKPTSFKKSSKNGTGRSIGLGNISRRIGMLYPGGKMQVYSRAGRGTVVRFEIPQTQWTEEREGEPS